MFTLLQVHISAVCPCCPASEQVPVMVWKSVKVSHFSKQAGRIRDTSCQRLLRTQNLFHLNIFKISSAVWMVQVELKARKAKTERPKRHGKTICHRSPPNNIASNSKYLHSYWSSPASTAPVSSRRSASKTGAS